MVERDRHLAAVWFADIVGYTQLSNMDEDAAFALVGLLQQHARAVIEEQDGRLVKCAGDAVLAEFRSTEAAVRAALSLRDSFEQSSRDPAARRSSGSVCIWATSERRPTAMSTAMASARRRACRAAPSQARSS
jgi:class 3 adenylate cyclase